MSSVLMNVIYHQFAFSGSGSHHTQNSCFTKAGQEYSGIIPSSLNVPWSTQIIFRPASFSFKKKIKEIKIMFFVISHLHVIAGSSEGRDWIGIGIPAQ